MAPADPWVLLSSVTRPFGGEGEGASVGAELFHAQVTRAQGAFSIRQVIRCWAIDYLAENVEAPCVTLHYPSLTEFAAELRRHPWTVVGVSFVVATFHKVPAMVALIRRIRPEARIVLGGYGTVLDDSLLRPLGDEICREEGVAFLRRILGERPEGPIRHPYAPVLSPKVFSVQLPSMVGHLTAGLGCPNGCDFCCTSHFFRRRVVSFVADGAALHRELVRQEEEAGRRGHRLSGFAIIDEDFFSNERRAREFLAETRRTGRSFALLGFGSARALARFEADEIAEMGFQTIWTAVEGRRAGYEKLRGVDVAALVEGLRDRGVALLLSMIVGFPYQTAQVVEDEFQQLLALRPAYSQFLIWFAFPGTPLHRRVIEEGLFRDEHSPTPDWRTFDGFSSHLRHPTMDAVTLEALQRSLYRREYETLGPSIVRVNETFLRGVRGLADTASPLLVKRRERMRAYLRQSLPGMWPARFLGPTRETRRHAARLAQDMAKAVGGLTPGIRLRGWVAVLLALWTAFVMRVGLLQQPPLLRTEHRLGRKKGLTAADSCGNDEVVLESSRS